MKDGRRGSVWDRARVLAGEKLSPVIVTGLKGFIAEKGAEEATSRGFSRIEVSYQDADEHSIPRKKGLLGDGIFRQINRDA